MLVQSPMIVPLNPLRSAHQPANETDPSVGIPGGDVSGDSSGIRRPQVHVGVDEMNKFAVSDLVNYLIAIGAGTSVFAAPYKLHFVAEFTNHVEAVVGRGVVEYKDGIVMLRQHLW